MPKRKYDDTIEHLQATISGYENNIIPRLRKNCKNPKFSSARKEGFKRLLQISNQELENCREQLKDLLTKGEIGTPLDDGTEVAAWQHETHPERKSLPFREWKKKYGDKYTKVSN